MNRFKITLVLLLSSLAAHADTVFVPNNPPIDSGGDFIDQPAGFSGRYQELFPAAQFGAEAGVLDITQFAWRVGRGLSGATIPSLEIRMSTTSATLSSLSPVLDANVGSDQTVVFPQGPYNSPTSSNPTGDGPFGIKFPLAQAFQYNPAQGNLLIELLISSPPGGPFAPQITFGFLNDANGISFVKEGAAADVLGPVTEFTFSRIPEPKICALITVGFLALVLFKRE